jgi:hypothetical protein
MGLLNKIFGAEKTGPQSVPPSATQFHDSDNDTDDAAARTATRRELVQVTLRETMRKHAVPSDWIECRILPVVTRKGKAGMHVQLVVRQGQGSLLTYIPSFQSSLMAEVEKFEPRAWDWLLSISWQFSGITSTSAGELPDTDWKLGSATAPAPPPENEDDDVMQDLQALFAIRDAALKPSDAAQPDFEPTRPSLPGELDSRR